VKFLALSFLLFTSLNVFSQHGRLPLDERNEVYYSDTGTFMKSKGTLYKITQNWITKTFGNYENAVTHQDSTSGKLVVSSYLPLNHHSLYEYVRFNLAINFQENKYTARIDQLDGITPLHTAARISHKENDAITVNELAFKTEKNTKKRLDAARDLELVKAGNDRINTAMYELLASLKVYLTENGGL
jgi:hypothetical protein